MSVDGRPDAVSHDEVAHHGDASALEVMTPSSGGLSGDELPDGLIILDADGTVRVLNDMARRLLRLPDPGPGAEPAEGRRLPDLVSLLDERGNDWWECGAPLLLLPGVTRQPERRLLLLAGAEEHELLVTVRYGRVGGAVHRVVVSLRGTESRERLERSRADLVSTVAHELR
jgi:signal transduction histidine kinase